MATIQESINRTIQMSENAIKIAQWQENLLNNMGLRSAVEGLNVMGKVLINSNLSVALNDFQKQLNHMKYSLEPIQNTLKILSEHLKPIDISGLYAIRNINLRYQSLFKDLDFNNLVLNYSKISSFDINNIGLIEFDKDNEDEVDFELLKEDEKIEVNNIISTSLESISRGEIYLDKLWGDWYANLLIKHPITAKLIAKVSSVIFENMINYLLIFILMSNNNIGNLPIIEEPNNSSQVIYNINISNVNINFEENINYYYKVIYVDADGKEQTGYVSKRKYTEVVKNLNEIAEE